MTIKQTKNSYNYSMQIKPYPLNAKKHPQKQIEQVANSIKEFGMNQPIVVDADGVIIVGHGRYEALKHLGMELDPKYVDVIVQRYVDYTGNEYIIKNGLPIEWKKK